MKVSSWKTFLLGALQLFIALLLFTIFFFLHGIFSKCMEQKDAATFIILVIAIIIFFLTLSFYKRVRNKRKLLSIDDHYEFIFKLAMENEGELNVVKLVKSSPYNYRLAHQYLMQSHQNGLSERVYLEEGEESYIF